MAAPPTGPPQVQRVSAFQRLGMAVHTNEGHDKGKTEVVHTNKGNDKGKTKVVHNNKGNDKGKQRLRIPVWIPCTWKLMNGRL